MAISDINRAMAAYSQPSEFDQNAWKTAFDIANGFTNAEHNRTRANDAARAYQENMATSANRVNYMNWDFGNKQAMGDLKLADTRRLYQNALQTDPSAVQATIAQNHYSTTSNNVANQSLQGNQEAQQIYAKYAFDANGKPRTWNEIYQTAQADGVTPQNMYAITPFSQAALQARANQQAALIGLANNSMGTTVDATGNVVSTGKIDPAAFDARANQMIATGQVSKEDVERFRATIFPPQTSQPAISPQTQQTFMQMYQALPPSIIAPYAVGNVPLNSVQPQAVGNNQVTQGQPRLNELGLNPNYATQYSTAIANNQRYAGNNSVTQEMVDKMNHNLLQQLLAKQQEDEMLRAKSIGQHYLQYK